MTDPFPKRAKRVEPLLAANGRSGARVAGDRETAVIERRIVGRRHVRASRLTTVLAVLVGFAAMYFAREVLIPFALAVLVSFLLGPLVARLQRLRFPRVLAVVTALLAMLAVTGSITWVVVGEARDLAGQIPVYRENIQKKAATLREVLERPFEEAKSTVKTIGTELAQPKEAAPAEPPLVRLEPPVRGPFLTLLDSIDPILSTLTLAAMVMFFTVVILLRPHDLRDRLIRLVGNGQIYVTTQALDEASQKVSAYLGRQLLVNAILGAGVAAALALIGLPSPVLWGLMFTLLRFVPYVGAWIAAAFPFLLSLAISDGWMQPMLTVGAYVAVELVANAALEPWLYGAGTGLSPLAILASTLFWSWLWGPIGLVLATPMTVCLVVMGKYVPQLHFFYLLCSASPVLSPSSRLYQRLLAQDADGAWSVIQAEVGASPPRAVYDAVVLPALSLVEQDRRRGALDDDAAAQLHDALQVVVDEHEDALASAEPGRAEAEPRSEEPPRVLCLPARGTGDVVAASVLARWLQRDGASVELVPLAELLGETLENVARRSIDAIFVSAVAPSGYMHVRYVCKRIARAFPELEIVLCMWTMQPDARSSDDRLPAGEHVHLATSLEEALRTYRDLVPRLRARRASTESEPSLPPKRGVAS